MMGGRRELADDQRDGWKTSISRQPAVMGGRRRLADNQRPIDAQAITRDEANIRPAGLHITQLKR